MDSGNITAAELSGDPRNLKDLFTEWKKAHENETGKTTFPCNKGNSPEEDFRKSFCRDGITSSSGKEPCTADPGNAKILFVMKESNLYDKKEKRIRAETKSGFWFNDKPQDPARIHYMENFRSILDFLPEPKKLFGYMNLNKHGGYGHTDPARLRNYMKYYRSFIKRQVEIMNPDIIICCGCYDDFMRIIEWDAVKKDPDHSGYIWYNQKKDHARVFYSYHPSNNTSVFQKRVEAIRKQAEQFLAHENSL